MECSCKRKRVKPRLFDSASEDCPERQHLKGLATSDSKQLAERNPDLSVGVRAPPGVFSSRWRAMGTFFDLS